jgi:hypothetical protein
MPYPNYIGQMPDPNAVMGPMPVAQGPRKQPSLWEKLQELVAPRPQQLEGLLGEKDVKDARNQGLLAAGLGMLENSGWSTNAPTLGQAISRGAGAGMQAYQGAIGNATQQAAQKQAIAAQGQGMDFNRMKMDAFKNDQAKVAQLDAARKQIIAEMGKPDTSNPDGMAQWIDTALPRFIEAGDEDTAQRLAAIRATLGPGRRGREPEKIDLGNKVILRDPVTGQVVAEYPKGIEPRDVAAGAQTRAEMSDQRRFQKEGGLRDDFNNDTKNMRQTASKLLGAIGETDRAMQGDGAAQVNMLYAFVNAMDPASAVREGEIGLARAASGPYDQARALLDKYLANESMIVPPALVRQMSELMKRRYSGFQTQVKERQDYYRPQAEAYGLDSERLFTGISPLQSNAPAGPTLPPKEQIFPQRRF